MTEEDPKQEQRGLPVAGCPVLHIRQEIVDLSVGMERRFRENASRGDPFGRGITYQNLLDCESSITSDLYNDERLTPDEFWQKTYDACNYLLMAAKKYEKENK